MFDTWLAFTIDMIKYRGNKGLVRIKSGWTGEFLSIQSVIEVEEHST